MLKNDNIEGVKASLLYAIKNELTETYPNEFGDYISSKGNKCVKVYWADTVRYQPRYPYCTLTPHKDISEGLDEVYYIKKADGLLIKRTVTRSFMPVTIEISDMGNENLSKSSLKADTFAHKVSRQLRKYFNGDDMLDWFSGNEYYDKQISVVVETDIDPSLEWSDTDTEFKYSFDIRLGWDEYNDVVIDKAEGAIINVYEDTNKIDEFTIKFSEN